MEVLIGLVLGTLLLVAVLQNYLSAARIVNSQQQLGAVQENFRFINYLLASEITQAGYAGCRKLSELNLTDHISARFATANFLHGYTANSAPTYLKAIVVPNTDVIVLQTASADLTRVISEVKAGAKSIMVRQNPATVDNQFLLIADCRNGDLFRAKNWLGTTISSATKISANYAVGVSTVSRYAESAYFIGDTGRLDAHGNRVLALYQMTNQTSKRELITDIIAMQIKYRIANKYYQTAEIIDEQMWQQVRAVVLTLTMASNLHWSLYVKLREV